MVILLMGVTGSGKTHVGNQLAVQLQWPFYDGDDYHPPENVAKMRSGTPLDDADRAPWLSTLADLIGSVADRNDSAVFACSALKEAYREVLMCRPEVMLVHLSGSVEVIRERLGIRVHRYMPANLLDSQFDTLEDPSNAVVVDVAPSPAAIVSEIRRKLEV
jgi:gluconokinase